MGNVNIRRILKEYGYNDFTLTEVEKGYRNESHTVMLASGAKLNLVIYKCEPDIINTIFNANKCGDFLANCGFNARKTVSKNLAVLKGKRQTKYACLYNYINGKTIPWEAYTMNHIKLLGKTMGDMHYFLNNLDSASYTNVAFYYRQKLKVINDYLYRYGVSHALKQKLNLKLDLSIFEDMNCILEEADKLPAHQALHMDFVRSNILFSSDKILDIDTKSEVGIIDFEKAMAGHPLFDIARTLAFLLVDCRYKRKEKIYKYFLISGYDKRSMSKLHHETIRLKNVEYSLLEKLVDLFLLYDFYKFLLHNPYESLPENEHFNRTKELLIERQMILRTDVTISHTV